MYFTADGVEKFLEIFKESADAIRQMEGCTYLELLIDIDDRCHYTTLSHWDNAKHLNDYRNSPLFRNVWGRVKPLFARRPIACSLKTT
jgi:quinol monooxygenase YgiN